MIPACECVASRDVPPRSIRRKETPDNLRQRVFHVARGSRPRSEDAGVGRRTNHGRDANDRKLRYRKGMKA